MGRKLKFMLVVGEGERERERERERARVGARAGAEARERERERRIIQSVTGSMFDMRVLNIVWLVECCLHHC